MQRELKRISHSWRLIIVCSFGLASLGCPSPTTEKQSGNTNQLSTPKETEIDLTKLPKADSLDSYLTLGGKLTHTLEVYQFKTGGAGSISHWIKLQPDGKWLGGGSWSGPQHVKRARVNRHA